MYKFGKKEVKKDLIIRVYKVVEKNLNNYIRKYINEVFIDGLKELNKEK